MSQISVKSVHTSGERVKLVMKENHCTQAQLAEKLDCSENHISMIVRGKRNLTVKKAKIISKLFGVRLEWLLGFDEYKTAWDQMQSITHERDEIRALITQLMQLHGYDITTKEFPVDVKRLTPEERKAYHEKPYKQIKYVIESNRPDRDAIFRVLKHDEVEKIFNDIDNFIEFTCSNYLKRPKIIPIR